MARDLFIGLDLATSAGWAVSDLKGVILASGNWYCKNDVDGFPGDRWIAYANALEGLLVQYKGRVQSVGYERPPVFSPVKGKGIQYSTVRVLFGQAALVEMLCSRHAIETESVQPATLKKVVTGKGNAPKQAVHDAVVKKTGPIHATGAGKFDQADARGVCLVMVDRRKG